MAVTRLEDAIVPERFTQYVQNWTMELSALITSGALQLSPELSALLAGGGLTFNHPFWKDLDRTVDENISTDDPDQHSVPKKIGSSSEIQIRMNRNESWSAMDLVGQLAGSDPMNAIAMKVGGYWAGRLQRAWIAMVNGVFADNAAAPGTGDTHAQNDMTFNASGAAFVDGVTNFSTEAYMDALQTMGDAQGRLRLSMMHSVVYSRALKNNLIDFVPDSSNGAAISIPTFLGRRVVVDDMMPFSGGVYQTWLFTEGATKLGSNPPPVATEVTRVASAGNGSGQDILHNRVQYCLHPVGYAYVGTAHGDGGPTNAQLAAAASWQRRYPERKQIGIARLITREHA